MRRKLAQKLGGAASRFAIFAGCACAIAAGLAVAGCAHEYRGGDSPDAGIVHPDSSSGAAGSAAAVASSSAAAKSGASMASDPADNVEAAGSAAAAACMRAQGLDGPGAPRDSCSSKRAYLKCDLPGGVTELCLSDDPLQCPEEVVSGSDVAAHSCIDQCAANEYAVACGGVGPKIGNAVPPEGCRALLSGPGGGSAYCCPCL
jgi:hypothetical protein